MIDACFVMGDGKLHITNIAVPIEQKLSIDDRYKVWAFYKTCASSLIQALYRTTAKFFWPMFKS